MVPPHPAALPFKVAFSNYPSKVPLLLVRVTLALIFYYRASFSGELHLRRTSFSVSTVQDVHLGGLDGAHAKEIEELRSSKQSTNAVALDSLEKIEDYIKKHAMDIYADGAVSYNCTTHPGKACKVRWSDERKNMDKTRPTTLLFGSPLCRPFFPDGGKMGKAHPGEEARVFYQGEIKWSPSLDLSMTENSHLFPAADFCDEMKQVGRVVKFIIAAPFDIGYPVGGERFFGFVLNPQRYVYCGEAGDNCTLNFLTFFQASVEVDGSIFACTDSENAILANREAYGKRHKPPVAATSETRTDELLAPRAQEYLKRFYDKRDEGKKISRSGSITVDVSQNPDERHRAGSWLPRLSRSSQLVHLDPLGAANGKEHIYTERELSGAHGWPTLDAFPEDLKKLLNFELSAFDLHKQSQTLGEGIHLPLGLAALWYFLAHTWRRSDLESLPPQLLPHIKPTPWIPQNTTSTSSPITINDEDPVAHVPGDGEGPDTDIDSENLDDPFFAFGSIGSPAKRRRRDA